MVNFPWRRET